MLKKEIKIPIPQIYLTKSAEDIIQEISSMYMSELNFYNIKIHL